VTLSSSDILKGLWSCQNVTSQSNIPEDFNLKASLEMYFVRACKCLFDVTVPGWHKLGKEEPNGFSCEAVDCIHFVPECSVQQEDGSTGNLVGRVVLLIQTAVP